jgi:hypothetical protein
MQPYEACFTISCWGCYHYLLAGVGNAPTFRGDLKTNIVNAVFGESMSWIFEVAIRYGSIIPNPPPADDAVTCPGFAAVNKIKKPWV